MSILLESLRQSSDKQGNDIPGVGDSHFDDEMLSDEWLLAKLRMWKIICALLVLALATTSIGWFLSSSQSTAELREIKSQSLGNQSKDSRKQISKSAEINTPVENTKSEEAFGALEIESSIEQQQSNTQAIKQKYVPQKVEQPVVSNSTPKANSSVGPQSQTTAQPKSTPVGQRSQSAGSKTTATGAVFDYESLSQQQQSEMPELEISSYAVSSNSKKSFVVLNGAFYGQGETIAPNLVLISIEKESIVVRYFDQLIRKKYGL